MRRLVKTWLTNQVLAREAVMAREFDALKFADLRPPVQDIQALIERSDAWFADASAIFTPPPCEFELRGRELRFTSPLASSSQLNNLAGGDYFRARGDPRAAVIVLGHWNADSPTYNQLARHYQRVGLSALRLSLPYHDHRRPADVKLATGMMSADIGLTAHSIRQAVLEVRAAITWLESKGYKRFGIVGSSLGSMIALLTACHEPRLKKMVGYLAGADFAHVVWHGSATQHIASALKQEIHIEDLHRAWAAVNPGSYLDRLQREDFSIHVGWARFDTICPPEVTRKMLERFTRLGVRFTEESYPCGHNTLALPPFIYQAGLRGLLKMRAHLRP